MQLLCGDQTREDGAVQEAQLLRGTEHGPSERTHPGFGLCGPRGLAELGCASPTQEVEEAWLVKRGAHSVARVMLKCQ